MLIIGSKIALIEISNCNWTYKNFEAKQRNTKACVMKRKRF